jgi:hypothetical protein
MVVMKGFLPRRGIGLCLLGVDNPSTYEDFCTGEVLIRTLRTLRTLRKREILKYYFFSLSSLGKNKSEKTPFFINLNSIAYPYN